MAKGKHRQRVTIVAGLSAVVLLVLGGLLNGFVGSIADRILGKATASPPLHVELSSDPEPYRAFSVIVPQPPSALGSPVLGNSGTQIMRWADSKGGAAADSVGFEIIIYGQADHPLIIDGLQPKQLHCSPPAGGTYFPPVGAGSLPQRLLSIDLDQASPAGKPEPNDEDVKWSFPLQVSASDAERIYVRASSNKSDCSFRLAVSYRNGGRKGTQEINDHGDPFRVVASSAANWTSRWVISGSQVTIAQRPKPS